MLLLESDLFEEDMHRTVAGVLASLVVDLASRFVFIDMFFMCEETNALSAPAAATISGFEAERATVTAEAWGELFRLGLL